jgi:alkaline phosphatase D
LNEFGSVPVKNVKIEKFDDGGVGLEPNNVAAINSLIVYRALRYGKHLDLLLTDERSFRGPSPFEDESPQKLADWGDYDGMFPDDLLQVLDGGRAFNGGNPPAEIEFNGVKIPNPRKDKPPQTILGGTQKAWFKDRLRSSGATWKIWGSSQCTLEQRADPENLPTGLTKTPWPKGRIANVAGGDFGSAWVERGEIYDLVRDAKITGFAIVAGDLHSFWAGYASAQLPPGKFEPIGLSFTGGSMTSVGGAEANEYVIKKDNKYRPLYLADRPGMQRPESTYNMMLRHGVRSCFEYAKSFDRAKAKALSNPDVAPHLAFVDIGGHGYATVRLTGDDMRTEFVCIPRPIDRARTPDGGPIRYRIVHSAKLWAAGERPRLVQQVLEGDPGLSI